MIRTILLNDADRGTVNHLGTFLAGVLDGRVDDLAQDIYDSDWFADVAHAIKADAWDEGYGKGYNDGAHSDDFSRKLARNPYVDGVEQ